MRRRPALTFTLVLLAAAALHAVSVARQSSNGSGAGERLRGDEDYVCTACGPIPKGGACPIKPPVESRSSVDKP